MQLLMGTSSRPAALVSATFTTSGPRPQHQQLLASGGAAPASVTSGRNKNSLARRDRFTPSSFAGRVGKIICGSEVIRSDKKTLRAKGFTTAAAAAPAAPWEARPPDLAHESPWILSPPGAGSTGPASAAAVILKRLFPSQRILSQFKDGTLDKLALSSVVNPATPSPSLPPPTSTTTETQ